MSHHDHAGRVDQVRDYLRQPEHRTTPEQSMAEHQRALDGIWNASLSASGGDVREALAVAKDAVRSTQQPGETHDQYTARLGGVPSQVFGTQEPNRGVDTPQHFFATAEVAYDASIGTMQYDMLTGWSPPMTGVGEGIAMAAGRGYEVYDEIRNEVGNNPPGYDPGDVVADDHGASFGAALAGRVTDPSHPPQGSGGIDPTDFTPTPEPAPGDSSATRAMDAAVTDVDATATGPDEPGPNYTPTEPPLNYTPAEPTLTYTPGPGDPHYQPIGNGHQPGDGVPNPMGPVEATRSGPPAPSGTDPSDAYTPASPPLDYTPGPGDPNYQPMSGGHQASDDTYTPVSQPPDHSAAGQELNYTPGPGDPNYRAPESSQDTSNDAYTPATSPASQPSTPDAGPDQNDIDASAPPP
jgi:hypothetical protein